MSIVIESNSGIVEDRHPVTSLNLSGEYQVVGLDSGVLYYVKLITKLITEGLQLDTFSTVNVRDLNEMTIPELKKYANENDVDLTGASLKADIIERINNET